MGLGVAGALALKRAARGSGSALVEFTALKGPFVQASNTPVDSTPIASAVSYDDTTGYLVVTFNTDIAANRSGFRSGHVYLTRQVSSIFPSFDPAIHELLAYVDKGDTDSGTGEILCALSLIDESTPSGTAQGTGGGWTQSSGTTDGVSVVQATSASVSNESAAPCRGAFLRFDFNPVGTTWALNFTIRGDATGTDAPAPNPVNNNYLRSNPKDCYLMLSIGKRLTDNLNGQVARVRAYVGYRLRSSRPNS